MWLSDKPQNIDAMHTPWTSLPTPEMPKLAMGKSLLERNHVSFTTGVTATCFPSDG